MFPETSGKPLEEVTAIFEDPNGIKYIGTPAWKTRNTWSTTSHFEGGKFTDEEWAEHERIRGASIARPSIANASEASPERKSADEIENKV